MIMSTAAARETRIALKASGGNTPVANFTTTKFTPQIIAIRNSEASVNQTAGPEDAGRPGTGLRPAISRMTRNLGGPHSACLSSRMHVSFALFADAANLSQEGKLNVLGVFDALQVATLPAMHPRATLVVHLKGTSADVGTHRVSMKWVSPSGSELWSSEGELGIAPPPNGVLEMDFPL